MQNYQRKHYKAYYLQTADGEEIIITRNECFAKGALPTAENPYKQCWFYAEDGSYAVRLIRNAMGEELYRLWDNSRKKDERNFEKHKNCTLLDNQLSDDDDNTPGYFEPTYKNNDPLAILIAVEKRETVRAVLAELPAEEQIMWQMLAAHAKKKVIANRLNLTLDQLYYKEKKLRAKLSGNKRLKEYCKNR